MSNMQDTLRALAARTAEKKGRTLARTEKRNVRVLSELATDVENLRKGSEEFRSNPAVYALVMRSLAKAENAYARAQEKARDGEEALRQIIEDLENAS